MKVFRGLKNIFPHPAVALDGPDSRPFYYQVTTLEKLFTPHSLSVRCPSSSDLLIV